MGSRPPPQIRPIAVCVIRRGDSIFVFEAHDRSKGETYYRPLGGAIEFGELGAAAVAREIHEEIGAELVNIRYLGALENLFELEEAPHHEIALVYAADFADARFYERPPTTATEDSGEVFRIAWIPLAQFENGRAPLYPDGLLELIGGTP